MKTKYILYCHILHILSAAHSVPCPGSISASSVVQKHLKRLILQLDLKVSLIVMIDCEVPKAKQEAQDFVIVKF